MKGVAKPLAASPAQDGAVASALRTLSAEMRQEALTRFESRASRLPALLTVPMIVFILPCVFLIVGGPAVVHVFQVMAQ